MRLAAHGILALVASAMLAGCSGGESAPASDAGSDAAEDAGDASSDAGDASTCGGLSWGSAACTACTHGACCSAEKLCAAIPSCAPLNACWSACGADAGCETDCGMQYIGAISNYNAILNCQSGACAAECSGPP